MILFNKHAFLHILKPSNDSITFINKLEYLFVHSEKMFLFCAFYILIFVFLIKHIFFYDCTYSLSNL